MLLNLLFPVVLERSASTMGKELRDGSNQQAGRIVDSSGPAEGLFGPAKGGHLVFCAVGRSLAASVPYFPDGLVVDGKPLVEACCKCRRELRRRRRILGWTSLLIFLNKDSRG